MSFLASGNFWFKDKAYSITSLGRNLFSYNNNLKDNPIKCKLNSLTLILKFVSLTVP